MRKPIAIVLGCSLALASVTAATAAPRKHVRIVDQLRFADAGTFSGTLSGHVTLNGLEYFIPLDVRAYEIGRGGIEPDTYVSMRMVSVSGFERNGSRIVTQIIVRPESFGADASTGIADANRPR